MRILIADDDPVMRRILHGLLSYLGHECVEASDGLEAWSILDEPDAPEFVVLDWMMPGVSGVELCERLQAGKGRAHQYILMLTARDSTDDLVRAMDAGADDYLRKPFDIRELRARVRAAERLLAAHDELRSRSITDDLTQVFNRRGILQRLEHELALVARDGRDLSVLMADVDHFKSVNDKYGHAVGDAVLRQIAGLMRKQLRPYDDVGRLGGEEFVAVLPACAGADVSAVAERIRAGIAGNPAVVEDLAVPLTVSIGATSVDTLADYEPAEIIARADRALYRAKSAGRNRVEFDSETMTLALTPVR